MAYKRFLGGFIFVCTMLWALPIVGHADETPFPEFTIIKPNVSFWINIYACYATTQAVVHDSKDLSVVYDVIDLLPADMPDARKTNRQRMKTAAKTYAGILKRLADDPSCHDADCLRVASMFKDNADANTFKQASRRVRLQLGQRDRFQKGLVRSGAYIEQIRAILSSHGLPEDLAYLPHVESSFNINAYSKYGAAGMWQFTRSTGRRFMNVDHLLDERLDPIVATHAAAELLKDNYKKLGSWPLAITAYNHGAAGMQRAKDNHGDYPTIFSEYNGRAFKFASRNFYSEFIAARKIAMNYQTYFGELDLKRPIYNASVCLDGFIGFAELCRHLGLNEAKVRSMNPALRPPVLNGQKRIPREYRLNLPGFAVQNDGNCLASVLSDLYHDTQKPSLFYTVQHGDTAGRIARLHKVSLEDLMTANNLNRRATIYVHQRLRIPQTGAMVVAENMSQPRETTKTVAIVSQTPARPNMTLVLASIPVEGEMGVYRRPEPTPAELIGRSDFENEGFRSPFRPQIAEPQPAADKNAFVFAHIEKKTKQPVGTLHVSVTETIGHYAEWAGVRASRIRRLNRIPFGNPLKLHQAIRIPLDRVSADLFEARRLSFHEQLQKEFFAAFKVEEVQKYRVKPGDSYWSLCHEKFNLPLWLLQRYNQDVDLASLQANQSLVIPAVQSITGDPAMGVNAMASPDA